MATYYWRRDVGSKPVYGTKGEIRLEGKNRKPVRATFTKRVPKGKYDVRIKRITADIPEESESRATLETQIGAFRFRQQVDLPNGFAEQLRTVIRVKATEQVNGTLDQYNAIIWAMCEDPRIGNRKVYTRNPALWFLKILRGYYHPVTGALLAGAGLSDDRINIAELMLWANFCDANNLYFGYEFRDQTTVAEALNLIARVGRASLDTSSGKVSVIWDVPNQTPVAIVGPANILPDSFSVSYNAQETSDEIVLRFKDANRDFVDDTVRVRVPGATTVGMNVANITLSGVVHRDQVVREGNLLAAAQVWRRRRIQWDMDFEGFTLRRGDTVLLSHDLTGWAYSGRVFAAASATEITLDDMLPPMTDGWLGFQRPDSAHPSYHRIAAITEETDTITLLDPLPVVPGGDGDHVPADYIWAAAPKPTPGKRVKIISREPVDDNRVRLVAIDDDLEYYASEFTPVEWVDKAVVVGNLPQISNLQVTFDKPSGLAGDAPTTAFLTWEVAGATYSEAAIYLKVDNQAIEPVGTTRGRSASFLVRPGLNYTAKVVVYGKLGALGGGNSAEVTWTSEAGQPPAVTNLRPKSGSTSVTRDQMIIIWDAAPYASAYNVRIVSGAFEKNVTTAVPEFTYTYEDAVEDGGPFRTVDFFVAGVNEETTVLRESQITMTNPPPPVPEYTVNNGVKLVTVTGGVPPINDFDGMLVWASQTQGFTPSQATLKYQGPNTNFTLSDISGRWYFRLAYYDTFGFSVDGSGLNLTDEFYGTAIPNQASYVQEAQPEEATVGDTWMNPAEGTVSYWTGSAWEVIANNVTSTSQLDDDAGLGSTADFNMIRSSPAFFDNFSLLTRMIWARHNPGSISPFDRVVSPDSDVSGDSVLRIGPTAGYDNVTISGQQPVQVRLDQLYRVRVRARVVAGPAAARISMGVVVLDKDLVPIGSYDLLPYSDLTDTGSRTTADGTWREITGYFYCPVAYPYSYVNPNTAALLSPTLLPSGARAVLPFVSGYTPGGSPNFQAEFDYFEIIPVPDQDAAAPNLITNPEFLADVAGNNVYLVDWTGARSNASHIVYMGMKENIGTGAPPWDSAAPVLYAEINTVSGWARYSTNEILPYDWTNIYTLGFWASMIAGKGKVRYTLQVFDSSRNLLIHPSKAPNGEVVIFETPDNPSPEMRPYRYVLPPQPLIIPELTKFVRPIITFPTRSAGAPATLKAAVTRVSFNRGVRPANFEQGRALLGTGALLPDTTSTVLSMSIPLAAFTFTSQANVTINGPSAPAEAFGTVSVSFTFELKVTAHATGARTVTAHIATGGISKFAQPRVLMVVPAGQTVTQTFTLHESYDVQPGASTQPVLTITRDFPGGNSGLGNTTDEVSDIHITMSHQKR